MARILVIDDSAHIRDTLASCLPKLGHDVVLASDGETGLTKEIRIGDINRPGLTLASFYDFFAYDRIQIFGLGESA